MGEIIGCRLLNLSAIIWRTFQHTTLVGRVRVTIFWVRWYRLPYNFIIIIVIKLSTGIERWIWKQNILPTVPNVWTLSKEAITPFIFSIQSIWSTAFSACFAFLIIRSNNKSSNYALIDYWNKYLQCIVFRWRNNSEAKS